MIFSRASHVLFPILALGILGLVASEPPMVEAGLQAAKSGVVLDAQTRRPLADAYVVVRWLEQSRTANSEAIAGQCLKRVIVRTDENGHYAIPATAVALATGRSFAKRAYFWDAFAYTPGYAATNTASHPRMLASVIPAIQDLEPMLLAPEHAQPERRVQQLVDSLQRFSCEPFANEFGPVAEQIYAEAHAVACLPEPNSAAGLLTRLHAHGHASNACESFRQVGTRP